MPLPKDIERAFASDTPIIAANARASRWLHWEYALLQRRMGRQAWTTPPISDWDTWLRDQWQTRFLATPDSPLLLTSLQERSIWISMQREDADLVVSPDGIAALAESAYSLLSAYEAHGERKHTWTKEDAERFRHWALNFDRECTLRGWMPRAALERTLASAFKKSGLPNEMLLVGFDRVTPAQNSLLSKLKNIGVQIRFAASEVIPLRTEFVRALDIHAEIATCARWTRVMLETNSAARIGILVPDLATTRAELERTFRRVLMPESDNIYFSGPMPFEFSLGQPLAQIPIVSAALSLLRWLHKPLEESELSSLLLSGFITKDAAERLTLARLDAKDRDSGALSPEISLEHFLNIGRGSRAAALVNLENTRKLTEANRISDEIRPPSRWTDIAQLVLREAGWPGGAGRGSVQFQAMRRWERVLDDLALLDFDGRRISYRDFLRELESHARETIFSPESQGAPVQIMGALEASGQQFDAVWFLAADDANWPPRGRPHPLLPNDVQRGYSMPFADPGNDLDLAHTITERIFQSAQSVVFSHALRNKDGELRPSPLLPRNAAWRDETSAGDEPQEPSVETIEEESAQIPWPTDCSPVGSEALKQQAACPFRAFATKRLRAEPLNRREWGLSAMERGTLLHSALEKIWSPSTGALHSLADLHDAISEGRLADILTAAITHAFAEVQHRADADPWMQAYLESEKRRLYLRLTDWMKKEADRVPFTVVACEKKLEHVKVGKLKLKLRADRIDQVEDSGSLLIDYKSGDVSPKDWALPRPNEPQLPLYAVFGGVDNVCGALFARIRAGKKMGFAGAVEDARSQLFPDESAHSQLVRHPYTPEMRDAWKDALLDLSEDFLRGEAIVDPKEGPETCKCCSLPGLCRLAEKQVMGEDGDESYDSE